MFVCTCAGWCICVPVCGSQRLTSGAFSNLSPFYFFSVSHCTQSSLISLSWLDSKLQGSAHLCFTNAGKADCAYVCVAFLMGAGDQNLGPHAYGTSTTQTGSFL